MKRSALILISVSVVLSIFLTLPPEKQAQTACSGSTSCSSGCNVPKRTTKLPGSNQYKVCTDSSVTNLNNPNLQTGITNMVSGWNSTAVGNIHAPTFTAASSGCNITVKAGTPQDPSADAEWQFDSETNPQGGTITVNSSSAGSWSADLATSNLTHELGHGAGLDDAGSTSSCSQTDSVMRSPITAGQPVACQPTQCDETSLDNNYSGGGAWCGQCLDAIGCLECNTSLCMCTAWNPNSPILVAIGPGANYPLVGAENGVWFDINADGTADRISWTAPGSLVAFLSLDRNHNGVIDHGGELFGTSTLLEGSQKAANGFEALAFFDQLENGGNGDGKIDLRDAVWTSLTLWIDINHNGLSEPGELTPLDPWGLTAFDLTVRLENRKDRFGNVFRFRSFAYFGNQRRPIYDVFFTTGPRR